MSPRTSVDPQHERLASADGQRWALGRNVKRHLPDHRWCVARVWTLRRREHGRSVTVAVRQNTAVARRWVDGAA